MKPIADIVNTHFTSNGHTPQQSQNHTQQAQHTDSTYSPGGAHAVNETSQLPAVQAAFLSPGHWQIHCLQ